MSYRYTVLGAGRQGVAIAYDLALHGEADKIALADLDLKLAERGAQKINLLAKRDICFAIYCDAKCAADLRSAIRGSHSVVSALPYFFNLEAAGAAVAERAHFADLGGNTDIVMRELDLNYQAKSAGISVLPDCGLAPGLCNLLAVRAFQKLDRVESIFARCGGLPQVPRPPFGYKLVFSLYGLINEYSGDAIFLRNGSLRKIPALTELEQVKIPGVGQFEAAVTSGGTSTAPYSFKGRLKNFDYKTLRFPGHFAAFKAFADLGLFNPEKREMFCEMLKPLIDFPNDKDQVILLVTAEGKLKKKQKTYRALLIDKGDRKRGFLAMERTTGFPTATVAHLQSSGKIPPGAKPIEDVVPINDFMKGLAKRGIKISEVIR